MAANVNSPLRRVARIGENARRSGREPITQRQQRQVAEFPADSVCKVISYSWRTSAYRSSSSAYRGSLTERFGVAMPFISLGLHKGAVCKTVGFS